MGTYDDTNDIFLESFEIDISPSEILTHIFYQFSFDFSREEWLEASEKEDAAKAAIYLKDYSEKIKYKWVRDAETAADITERKLNLRKGIQTHVFFRTALHALQDDLVEDITVVHNASPSLDFVTIIEMDLDMDNLSVEVVALAYPDPITWHILQENGDYLLQESGDYLVLETKL